MSLSNVGRVTTAEMALEPRSLGVLAWFDGWGQAHGGRPTDYPRRLTASEGRDWREGWNEGKRERACHDAHGFARCTPEAHDLTPQEA